MTWRKTRCRITFHIGLLQPIYIHIQFVLLIKYVSTPFEFETSCGIVQKGLWCQLWDEVVGVWNEGLMNPFVEYKHHGTYYKNGSKHHGENLNLNTYCWY